MIFFHPLFLLFLPASFAPLLEKYMQCFAKFGMRFLNMTSFKEDFLWCLESNMAIENLTTLFIYLSGLKIGSTRKSEHIILSGFLATG